MNAPMVFRTDNETGDVIYEPEPAPDAQTGPLVDLLTDEERTAVVNLLTEQVGDDSQTQEQRQKCQAEFWRLLGIGPESTPEDEEVADTSDHPLMLTALLRFQAKALSTLLPSDDRAVRTQPAVDLSEIEDQDERDLAIEQTNAASERVIQFYTEYLFERLPAYEEDTDRIVGDMGLMGVGLRKIVFDPAHPHTPVMPEYAAPEDVIISYHAKSLRHGRITHQINMQTNDLIRKIVHGQYRPARLARPGTPEKVTVTEARDTVYGLGAMPERETHKIIECYCELFLEADPHPEGLARPYIVTVHEESQELLAIQRNWREGDPAETPLEHFVAYIYHPGKSAATGIGLGDLLASVTRALRRAQRHGLDAAYLHNHPSGFKLADLSIRDEATRVRRGQFIDVDSPTQDIRAAIMPHIFTGPSPGLLQLAEGMQTNGKELGGIASIDFTALMKAGVAAGPAMAAFEESTEVQTSVHRRLYKAARKELKLIHDLMRVAWGDAVVLFADGRKQLRPGDLHAVDIVPYMQPGQASKQRQLLEAQMIYDLSKDMPDIIDRRQAAEDLIRALGKTNLDDIMIPNPEDEQPEPLDPISEYSLVLAGKPVAAGLAQDHQSHIDTHAAQMRMLMQSQLPVEQAATAAAVLSAHIAEHMGMQMLVEVTAKLGLSPDDMAAMPPELESHVAPAIANAVQELEAMRRPPETADPRLTVAQIKAQADGAKTAAETGRVAMKLRHEREIEELRHKHAMDLQALKDEAAMEREIEDNAAAVQTAKVRASAGASAGVKSGG